jgi:hypothetical protein
MMTMYYYVVQHCEIAVLSPSVVLKRFLVALGPTWRIRNSQIGMQISFFDKPHES